MKTSFQTDLRLVGSLLSVGYFYPLYAVIVRNRWILNILKLALCRREELSVKQLSRYLHVAVLNYLSREIAADCHCFLLNTYEYGLVVCP